MNFWLSEYEFQCLPFQEIQQDFDDHSFQSKIHVITVEGYSQIYKFGPQTCTIKLIIKPLSTWLVEIEIRDEMPKPVITVSKWWSTSLQQ